MFKWKLSLSVPAILKTALAIASLFLATFAFESTLENSYAAPPGPSKKLSKKGAKAYKINCVSCHGVHGDGQGDAGKFLKPPPRNFSKDKFKQGDSPQNIFDTISKGVPGTVMVGYGHLPEEDLWGLVYYILDFKSGKNK